MKEVKSRDVVDDDDNEVELPEDPMSEYEDLKAKVQELIAAGKIESTPSRAQRIDFAYGNTKIENADVTLEMAVRAVDAKR